jgi:hypothetical protein
MDTNLNKVNFTQCVECGKELPGRIGQKFCNVYCKSAFHYKKSKHEESSRYDIVLTKIKLNRRILKMYNLAGQSQINEELLLKEGFDSRYHTNSWSAKNGNKYYFCFEFGFRNLNDGKYMLIKWQNYMESD